MELNLSTFLLEIINFLVLVWILKRFLYKPVLAVIARRKAGIEQTLAEAEDKHRKAAALRDQYEGRVAEWEQERRTAREKLAQEIEAERQHQLEEVHKKLAEEQQKTEVADARSRADALYQLQETALRQGSRFASRLLSLGAGPETQARLLDLLIDDLPQLSAKPLSRLRSAATDATEAQVVSSFPLAPEQLERLRQALATAIGRELPLQLSQDPQLLAGTQITIGAWVLGANVRDELQGFADLAHES